MGLEVVRTRYKEGGRARRDKIAMNGGEKMIEAPEPRAAKVTPLLV